MKGRDTIDAIEAGDRATIQQGFRTLIDPREGKVELGADRRIVRAVTR